MQAKGIGMSAQENRILRLPEVMRLTGLSKATIHRRYRDGTFPRPLRLGPSRSDGGLRRYSSGSSRSSAPPTRRAMAGRGNRRVDDMAAVRQREEAARGGRE